jgi:uncharacterized glyoxalase superfamily protein PhnB
MILRMSTIHPRLIVSDADRAIDFYRRAFGAELLERFRDDALGRVVHAAVSIGGATVALADEDPAHGNVAPTSLDGSPVLLQLVVDDAFAAEARMLEAGGEAIFPVADRFYGKREGRLRDPFGHVWILTQPLEALSPEEIQRRLEQQG